MSLRIIFHVNLQLQLIDWWIFYDNFESFFANFTEFTLKSFQNWTDWFNIINTIWTLCRWDTCILQKAGKPPLISYTPESYSEASDIGDIQWHLSIRSHLKDRWVGQLTRMNRAHSPIWLQIILRWALLPINVVWVGWICSCVLCNTYFVYMTACCH